MKTINLLFAILFAAGLNSSQAQNTWTKKANFGGGTRGYAVAWSIGSKGYISTGDNFAGHKDCWEYDPTTNAWSQKANYQGGLTSSGTGFSAAGKGYLLGGGHNDFWEFDPVTNTWIQKTNFPGVARIWSVGFSINGKGYIGSGTIGPPWDGLSDFWQYDPATDKWAKKADVCGGIGRTNATGFSIGNKGYIGTGGNLDSPVLKDFWEYDPATDKWTQKADFAADGLFYSTGFSIASKGYIGTGTIYGGSDFRKFFFEYDPATDKWTQKADFGGTGRYYSVSFSINGKGYLGTGYTSSSFVSDFWEYTPDCYQNITVYADADGDGYGNANKSKINPTCDLLDGYVLDSTDCDDTDSTVYVLGIFYVDSDGDTYGTGPTQSICYSGTGIPPGYSNNNTDCDDTNAAINPKVKEIIGDGIDNNCNGLVDEKINNALSFDGVNDYIITRNLSSFMPANNKNMTVELWFKANSAGVILDELGQSAINTGWHDSQIEILSTGEVRVRVWPLNGVSIGTVSFGKWNHAVVRYNAATQRLDGLLNGVPSVGFTTGVRESPTANGYNQYFALGAFDYTNLGSGAFFNGTIDEVRIWNTVRTDAEIQKDIATNRICGSKTGLVAYYSFNEGIAGGDNVGMHKAPDVSPNSNHGTLKNFALNGSTSNWVDGVPGLSDSATFYRDADRDGYGNAGISVFTSVCHPPKGYVQNGTDCDDANAALNPGAKEIIGDGVDNNCNGVADENNALDFDGTDDYVDVNKQLGNFGVDDFSVEFNVKTSKKGQYVVSKRQACDDGIYWNIGITSSGVAMFELNDSYQSNFHDTAVIGKTIITNGKWHHIAVTRRNRVLALFVDGQLESSINNHYDLSNTASLQIGKNPCGLFTGDIDELRFWNGAISQAQIQAGMNTTLTGNEKRLVAYYPFNQGIAGSNNAGVTGLQDFTANKNDGTLHGFGLAGAASNWIKGVPVIPGGCVNPDKLKVSVRSGTSAKLIWELPDSFVKKITISYRPAGTVIWITKHKTPLDHTIILHGLSPNTTYEWKLRNICAVYKSTWVEGPDFTTASATAFAASEDNLTAGKIQDNISVQIIPNPSKGNFTAQLHLPNEAMATKLTLYNSFGKKLWEQDAGDMKGIFNKNISLENKLPAGVYMLMIQRGDARLIQKVVVVK